MLGLSRQDTRHIHEYCPSSSKIHASPPGKTHTCILGISKNANHSGCCKRRPAKGVRSLFFVFRTLSVTFRSLFLTLLSFFSSLFCQTPLPDSFCGRVNHCTQRTQFQIVALGPRCGVPARRARKAPKIEALKLAQSGSGGRPRRHKDAIMSYVYICIYVYML